MNIRLSCITAVYLCLNFLPLTASADTVFLKNGREIKVEKAWQEGDQIWLIYHGMQAGLPRSKVTRIESDSINPGKSGALESNHLTANKISDPQPAGKILPNQINQIAETTSTAQQPVKAPFLRSDGFGNLKWGAKVSSIRGLVKKQTDSGLTDVIEYVRPNETLRLGEATLKSIVYAFWRDELYTVTVWTQGPASYKALRQNVFDQFGQGIRPDRSIERYLWSDGPTDAMLKYANDNQYGMLWMRCQELDRKFKLSKLNGHTTYLKLMKSRN